LAKQPGFHKRRARLTETIEWVIGVFAQQSPGYYDDLVLLDSTPVGCARSVETVRRSQLADAAGYGYCRSHSRWFFGFRLHLGRRARRHTAGGDPPARRPEGTRHRAAAAATGPARRRSW
jgi:hypothetical protein